jgi:hypothetical protein
MNYTPGRERHVIHRCEHCGKADDGLEYNDREDEYWCGSCIDNEAEAAWDRHQQDLMENGPGPTLAEQQAEARKFK